MIFTFLIIFVLSICYLTFFYNEHAECEAERQALIASIEKLRTKPRGTFTKDNNPQNPPKKRGRLKKNLAARGIMQIKILGEYRRCKSPSFYE